MYTGESYFCLSDKGFDIINSIIQRKNILNIVEIKPFYAQADEEVSER
jgi:hypothetical protein